MPESKNCSEMWEQSLEYIETYYGSDMNKYRARVNVKKFAEYLDWRCPDASAVLEYSYHLIKHDGVTPGMFKSIWRYIKFGRPIMHEVPKLVACYIKQDLIKSQDELEEALRYVNHPGAKAFAAIGLAGLQYQTRYLSANVGDYDPNTGVLMGVKKFPPWIKKYIDVQYEAAIAAGIGPDGPLFFTVVDGVAKRMIGHSVMRSINASTKRSGVNIRAHIWLMYKLYFAPPGGIIKYI